MRDDRERRLANSLRVREPVGRPVGEDRLHVELALLATFVGRERELDELRSLLRGGKRLVTLVGIGGIGKTRLAWELGRGASDLGWAKAYVVELASLADPGLAGSAVLESVGSGSSRSPLPAVEEYLREATALLVLDCCEHVLYGKLGVHRRRQAVEHARALGLLAPAPRGVPGTRAGRESQELCDARRRDPAAGLGLSPGGGPACTTRSASAGS